MSTKPSLTVIIMFDAAQSVTAQRAAASVHRADDGAVFQNVKLVMAPDQPPVKEGDDLQRRASALAHAECQGADWICFLEPGEELTRHALQLVAPALQKYDGIWGGLALNDPPSAARVAGNAQSDAGLAERKDVASPTTKPAKRALYTGQTFLDLCHMGLQWWIGRSHFVRANQARSLVQALLDAQTLPGTPAPRDVQTLRETRSEPRRYGDYLIALWTNAACLKTAQPLTCANALPPVDPQDQQCLLAHLKRQPQFIEFDHGGQQIKLAYSGRNPTLERVQMRGLFFEAQELAALARHVSPGAVIMDIGANTGNHMVYFAKILKARAITVFEPNPEAIAILRQVIAANELQNINQAFLGKGVGARAMRSSLSVGRRGHLGSVQLRDAPDGTIEIVTLDDCLQIADPASVFGTDPATARAATPAPALDAIDLIKIDVENMELDVLAGARKTIAKCKPVMLVEVMDANIAPFLTLIAELDYQIEDIYPDQGYANYIIVPIQGERRA